MSVVNVRQFEGVEVEKLRLKDVDGRSYTKETAEARVAEIEAQKQAESEGKKEGE